MENKKIKGATITEYDGMRFRSKLESKVAKYLKDNNISFEYEPFRLCLLPSMIYNGQTLKSVHYTPDFKLSINGYTFYIEVKGYPNDLWPYKKKLFLKLIENDPKTFFFEVKTKRGLLKTLKIIKSIYEQENTNPDNGGTVMQPS